MGLLAIFTMYRSCGTFSYRERLLQQNGDIGKRDGGKTTCIWAHLVQGHVYSSPSPPSPPLTPPSNVITRAAGLRTISFPSHPLPPPLDYGQILTASPKVEDGFHFGDCEYDS